MPLGCGAASCEERPRFVRNDVFNKRGMVEAVVAHSAFVMNSEDSPRFQGFVQALGPVLEWEGSLDCAAGQTISFHLHWTFGVPGVFFAQALIGDKNSFCQERKMDSAGRVVVESAGTRSFN